MDDLLSGLVVAVTNVPVGTQTAAAVGGATIPFTIPQPLQGPVLLDDTIDMSPTGGQVTIDGGVPLTYTASDDDASTITLAVPLTAALAEGAEVLVYPPRENVTALTLIQGASDPIPVTVPHNKRDTLPVGVREEEDREEVRLTRDGEWSWAISDVSSGPLVRDVSIRVSDDEGGISGGVDDYGNVTASALSYQSEFQASAETMMIDGVAYATHLAAQPSGIIRFAERDPAVTGIQAEYGILNVDFSTEVARNISIWCVVQLRGSVTPTLASFRVRHETSTTAPVSATVASSSMRLSQQTYAPPVANQKQDFEFSHTTDLPAGWHSLWLSVTAPEGAGRTFDSDGVARITVQDQGPPALVDNGAYRPAEPGTLTGGTDTGSTAAASKRTYTRSYDATTTNWWEGDGTYRAADNQYVGYLAGEGNRKTAIWFDEGRIRSDLQGSTVLSARVRLSVWEGGNGKTLVVGSHTKDFPTQDYSAITGKAPDRTRKTGVNEGTSVWVNLPFELSGWKTDLAGLVVGPGPTNAGEFKFSYRGAGHANRPVLEITYEK